MDLSRLIRECRQRSGITQDALAKSLGVSRTAVSNWESGRRTPGLHILYELCIILDVPANEFENLGRVNFNNSLSGFKLARLNADGRKKLYEYYYGLLKDGKYLR